MVSLKRSMVRSEKSREGVPTKTLSSSRAYNTPPSREYPPLRTFYSMYCIEQKQDL